jgi:hypothetical protein
MSEKEVAATALVSAFGGMYALSRHRPGQFVDVVQGFEVQRTGTFI